MLSAESLRHITKAAKIAEHQGFNDSFHLKCTQFWVDAFPFGILGELDLQAIASLCDPVHVARYVTWPAYQARLKSQTK